MNALFALLFVAIPAIALAAWFSQAPKIIAANIGEGTSASGNLGKRADAAIARYSVVKFGSDGAHVAAITSASATQPLGMVTDQATAAEDPVNVALFGATIGTMRGIVNGAVALTDRLFITAGVKLQPTPVASGTYWEVGRPVITAAADGDTIVFVSCYPIKLVIP